MSFLRHRRRDAGEAEAEPETVVTESEKPSARHAVRRAGAFLLAVLTVAIASTAVTLAWVSENRKVTDSGLSFRLNPDILDGFVSNTSEQYVAITGDEQILATDLSKTYFMPGTRVEFDIGLMNKSDKTVSIESIGLDAPTVWTASSGTAYSATSRAYDEVPVYDAGTDGYYYFGKQMKIAVIQYTVYRKAEKNGNQTVVSDGVTQHVEAPVYTGLLPDENAPQSFVLLSGLRNVVIEQNQVAVFRLSIVFEKVDADQSQFVGFGSDPVWGRCSRNIYITFNGS